MASCEGSTGGLTKQFERGAFVRPQLRDRATGERCHAVLTSITQCYTLQWVGERNMA